MRSEEHRKNGKRKTTTARTQKVKYIHHPCVKPLFIIRPQAPSVLLAQTRGIGDKAKKLRMRAEGLMEQFTELETSRKGSCKLQG
jgi:hypothetical protein